MVTEIEKQLALQIQPLLTIDVDSLDGREFEKYCAGLLTELGYINVKITPGSGDYGIDILAEKDELVYGFQCKCYSSNIGVKAVQEVSSGSIYYNCDRAIVITNNYFTPAAINMAKRIGVILWDRKEIEKLISTVLENTIKKINQDEKLKIIKKQKEEQKKSEKLKYQKLLEEQLRIEAIRLKEKEEKELKDRELKRKQQKKLAIKYVTIIVTVLIVVAILAVLGSKFQNGKNMQILKTELYSISKSSDFTIVDIQIESQDKRYECVINSSDFNKLTPQKMYLFYNEFQDKMDELKLPAFIRKIKCMEDEYVFSNSTIIQNGHTIYNQLEEDKKKKEEELKREYGQDYPQLGMREEALPYTKLGEPDRITKCKDFDHLQPRAQSKEYEWGEPLKPGYFSVKIRYKRHLSNRVDDYVEYPSDNGYVFSIYYYDEYGQSHSLDMLD